MPTPRYPNDFAPQQGNPNTGGKKIPSLEMLGSEIRRREMMLLNFLGELCDLWIAKESGDQCGCYRPEQGQVTNPDCPGCFGTGYVGGYDLLDIDRFVRVMTMANLDNVGRDTIITPNYKYLDQLQEKEIHAKKFLVRFPSSDNAVNNDKFRLYDSLEVRGWTTLTLPLKPRDIVIRPNGERYRVKSVKIVKNIRGMFTHQKFTLQLVDQADSVYNVGILPTNYETTGSFEDGLVTPFEVYYGSGYYLEEYMGLLDFDTGLMECC